MASGPIVIGGGATWWPQSYRGFAETLREVSGSEVYVAPITPLDWALGYFRGFGQLVFAVAGAGDRAVGGGGGCGRRVVEVAGRGGRALLGSESKQAVLVGHSAGGLACRVFIGGDPPYGGRRYSGDRRGARRGGKGGA